MRRVVVVAAIAASLVAAATFSSSCVGYLDDDEDCTGRREYAQAVVAANPLLYLRFGEKPNATVARDEMGMFSGTYATTGIQLDHPGALKDDCNKAVYLDAAPPAISMPRGADFDMRQPFTVEVWILPDAGANDTTPGAIGYIVDHESFMPRAGWDLLFSQKQVNLEIWLNDSVHGVANSMTAPSTGDWHYIVGEYDGMQGMQLWIDDVAVFQGSVAGASIPAVPSGWTIGTQNCGCPGNSFTGAVDELAIYPYVLTQEVIDAHWKASGRPSPQ